MTIYTWKINSMYTVQQPDPNYVVNVFWTLSGVDGTATASVQGSTPFKSQQSTTFIPFDQLTEATVIEWVKADLGETGIASYEAGVQGQIDLILNPPSTPENTPLPWSN